MPRRHRGDRIRSVLADADAEGPFTAREMVAVLSDHDVDVASPHRVATILGREAGRGEVDVIREQSYRYEV
jgi:hypothetical protein